MLDVTDNLVGGAVVAPPEVVRHDGDDTYLVVAADKGTATFSDIANEIAESKGFWLADAFASGGSAGYDHKKMAITARGAWESVRATSWRWASTPRRLTSPWWASGTCRVTSSAMRCCCPNTSSWSPRSTTGMCSWIRIRIRLPPMCNAAGCSTCPAPPGTTTTGRCSPKEVGSGRGPRRRSRSALRCANCSPSLIPRSSSSRRRN